MYEAPMMDQQQYQQDPMAQQQMMQPPMQPQDPVADAKAMLGLDVLEAKMIEHTNALEQARLQSIQNEMKAKYPDVSDDAVTKEIERISKDDPALAEAMMKSSQGFETIYKAIVASSKPHETPDEITDSAGNLTTDSLERKVRGGKASQIELGDYILGLK